MPPSEAALILNAVNSLREELMGRIDRLDDKVDSLARNGCSRAELHEDVEQRVRSLEIDRAKIAGIVSVISVAISIAGWAVSHFFSK